ncbi:hypothetical protein [Alkaliphilus hydrothermalis]|uniref:Chromosome condensin MukBEF MukE localization factor n=1 Tax=Alkaliphilus hydrothermalis TaxID=1482730 RepID=A0ABS2NT68_9FIRM|nr:hypothetical protein [Alkaliphilus hydrothermalis]MBM7616148.1 chromosome condensin MukBEF MukE localization factor [Alkaliphilus hydrothermalis]
MSSTNKQHIENEVNENKIEWLGMDGFLVILFPIISTIIGYSLINNVDFIVGKVVPYTVTAVTTLIFLKYISEVLHFSKGVQKKI